MTTTAGAAGLVQVGIGRGHPALGAAVAAPPARGVALATCHRVELYLERATPEAALQAFRTWTGAPGLAPAPIVREGPAAARHLLWVAAGLDSTVLGEDQILAQVRGAYRDACSLGSPGPLLHRLFHTAFRTGRRVRHETALGAGTRSLAGAGVAALHRRAGGLRGLDAAVFGAGEMGAIAARLLAGRGVGRLAIASRTFAHAEAVARATGAQAVRWEWREGLLRSVDVLVCAVRADRPVVSAAALRGAAAGRVRPLVVADLGMPPNVERGEPAGVDLIDLDALATLGRRDAERRAAAVEAAAAIVEEELESLVAWSRTRADRDRAARVAAG